MHTAETATIRLPGLCMGPAATRRHRDLREAALKDRDLVAFIRQHPKAGVRARLIAIRKFAARRGICIAGLQLRYRHADLIWSAAKEAGHGEA